MTNSGQSATLTDSPNPVTVVGPAGPGNDPMIVDGGLYFILTNANSLSGQKIGYDGYGSNLGRAAFDNHAEYLDLYGSERIIPEMAQPRISTARLLPDALKARLGIFGGTTAETAPVRAVS